MYMVIAAPDICTDKPAKSPTCRTWAWLPSTLSDASSDLLHALSEHDRTNQCGHHFPATTLPRKSLESCLDFVELGLKAWLLEQVVICFLRLANAYSCTCQVFETRILVFYKRIVLAHSSPFILLSILIAYSWCVAPQSPAARKAKREEARVRPATPGHRARHVEASA